MQRNEQLTRAELAKSAGISKSKVRRMEARGELKPTINERGVRLYRFRDVMELIGDREVVRLDHARPHVPSAAKVSGELCAAVFEMLDDGEHPVDIVCKLKVHYDVIDGIVQKWVRWRRAATFTGAMLKDLAEVLGIPPSYEPETLIYRARKAMRTLRQTSTCSRCNARKSSYCSTCANAHTAPTSSPSPALTGLVDPTEPEVSP